MQKFLVIQLARFGDILQSKRLILSLQQKGEVTLLIDNTLESIAKLVYPSVNIIGLPIISADNKTQFSTYSNIFQRLKEQKFDEVYPLNHSPLCQSITTLFKPETLQGYTRHNGYLRQSLWVQLAFRWLANRKKTPINLVDFWAYFTNAPLSAEKINPIAKGKGNGICVAVAGQNARRSLSPKEYATIIHTIFEREVKNNTLHTEKIYLLGTQKEENIAKQLYSALPSRVQKNVENLTGKTNFINLQEILTSTQLLISPDTGTAHFSAHLGTPVEGFYLSSANMFETGPYGKGHRVWQANLPCSPCKEFENCPFTTHNQTKCATAFTEQNFYFHLFNSPMQEDLSATFATNQNKKKLENIVPYTSTFLLEDTYSFAQTWESPVLLPNDIARTTEKEALWAYIKSSQNVPHNSLYHIEKSALFSGIDYILPQQKP